MLGRNLEGLALPRGVRGPVQGWTGGREQSRGKAGVDPGVAGGVAQAGEVCWSSCRWGWGVQAGRVRTHFEKLLQAPQSCQVLGELPVSHRE